MSPRASFFAGAVILASVSLHGATPAEWRTLEGARRDGPAMDAFLPQLMARNGLTALSVAVVDGGDTVYARTLGVVNSKSRQPADEHTVFRAASLSKPVFAYLVMRLVDEGVLDLDTPVHRYLPWPLHTYPAYASFRDDPGHQQLTARLLLSHQGGLPNWRRVRPDGPIAFDSAPGERFGYSGERYALLQFVVETVTGRDLAALAREKVFDPLGMSDTDFLWETRFDGRFAVELDSPLGGLIAQTRRNANAAASIITNAVDYARFAAAVINGTGLKAETRTRWLEPQVAITSKSLFSAPGTNEGVSRAHKLAWTPGSGTFDDVGGRALFHVGMEEGCENFVEIFLERKLAVAFLSLTDNRQSFSAALVEYFSWPRVLAARVARVRRGAASGSCPGPSRAPAGCSRRRGGGRPRSTCPRGHRRLAGVAEPQQRGRRHGNGSGAFCAAPLPARPLRCGRPLGT